MSHIQALPQALPKALPKVIIFVHTCGAYFHSRSELIEQTWALGKSNVVFITDDQQSANNDPRYKCIGEYKRRWTYHPENVKKMFQLFLCDYADTYDFFMFVDDDSYVFVDKLAEYLSFFDKNQSYMIGDYLSWLKYRDYEIDPVMDYSRWIGGGPGVVFTKSCIETLMSVIEQGVVRDENHDVWLHDLWNHTDRRTIQRIHCPGFHQYGHDEAIQRYPKDSRLLISIHFNHDLAGMVNFHNR